MATAYHLDGTELVLTHYCIGRINRSCGPSASTPRPGRSSSNSCGRQPPLAKLGHMRRALYRLVDSDHFVTEWEFFENGTKKMTEVETFTRVRK